MLRIATTAGAAARGPRARRSPALLLLALLATILAGAEPARAQGQETAGAAPAAPPAEQRRDLASPRDCLRTFLDAMSAVKPDLTAASECLDHSGMPGDAVPELTGRLYRILNRIEFVDLDDPSIPDADRIREATSWTFFPPDRRRLAWARSNAGQLTRWAMVQRLAPESSIVLEADAAGNWRFSKQTVKEIEAFWDEIGGMDPVDGLREVPLTMAQRLESLWPESLVTSRVLGVRLWQWATLVAAVAAGVVLDLCVRVLLGLLAARWIAARGGRAEPETIRRTMRPFGLVAGALLWLLALGILGLPADALRVLGPAVRLIVMFAAVWAAWRVVDLVGEVALTRAGRTETKFDDLLVPLVRKTTKIVIAVFGLIYIASAFELEITPLLTGLGIGGVGFAFAAKDTLENFFGSVTVVADRPFQVGDWVTIGAVDGTVEELGLRSVRVRTFYNSLVTIPTANLVRATVDNYGQRKYRRWKTHVAVTYDTAPEALEAFCEGIREMLRIHPYTRKDYYQVWVHEFGAHSIDVLVYVFFEAPDWTTELRERHRLMLDVLRLADRLGVRFAFPTQTIHLERTEPGAGAPAEPPERSADFRAFRAGRRAAREVTGNAAWRERIPGPYVFSGAADEAELPDDGTQIETRDGGDA